MSPRILALDTATEFGSLALLQGTHTVEEVWLHSPEGFAHVLYPELERLLARHGWELESVDLFAAAAGPGSFTGIRVALAAVKGLAEVFKRPVVGVSNLQAVASFGTGPLRAAVLDARRGEIYGAVYSAALELVSPEVVMPFRSWLETLPAGVEFVSTDFTPFRAALAGTKVESAPVRHAPRALAAAVGRIAAERWARGQVLDPAALDGNYVRRSDAEIFSSGA
ncbi:MAG: tRNA (adenosine(37)-N6)-threonylcarbamoyltransferase complex dimerization subunit type 1 TsaB [Bryobacteraceae bacterium]|nr:tRNA (adenosine(37)-N6)-threonylcarbamoyltransferase complex dimerization subunit type 1 TsaB [Bryobacteraceae bacterium]